MRIRTTHPRALALLESLVSALPTCEEPGPPGCREPATCVGNAGSRKSALCDRHRTAFVVDLPWAEPLRIALAARTD